MVAEGDEFAASEKVELVAIVKGWSTEGLIPWRKDDPGWVKFDCYFVLYVARDENGVSKRRASGEVRANLWDEVSEPVDLILG